MAKITWTFKNEEGTNLNRYIATNVSTGEKITFDLLRGGNISVVGTPLNAENLNALITAINACYDLIDSSEKDTTYTLSKNGNAIRLTSSSGAINDVTLDKSDVGLGNVDNTSDMDKPISTAQQNAINKPLYNLGAFDTISGNVITRKTGYLYGKDLSSLNVADYGNITYYKIPKPIGSLDYGIYSYNAITNKYPVYQGSNWNSTECIGKISGSAEAFYYWVGFTKGTTQAQALTDFQDLVLQYQLATSYTEEIIEGQPLITLDQQGSQWLRDEWEKGLNLLTDNVFANEHSKNNLTYTVNGSIITINTTNSNDPYVYFENCFTLDKETTITLSLDNYNNIQICGIVNSGTTTPFIGHDTKPITITLSAGTYGIGFETNDVGTNTYKVMLNYGDRAYPYQPYNSKAHITNYEADFLKEESLKSANLINKDLITLGSTGFVFDLTELKEYSFSAGTYTFSYNYSGSNTGEYEFQICDMNDSAVLTLRPRQVIGINTITFTTNTTCYLRHFYSFAGTYNNFMLNEGTEPLPYQEYNGSIVREKQLNEKLNDKSNKSDVYTKSETDNELAKKVPITRKINNKSLNEDITLSASDVGARPSSWTPSKSEVGLGNVDNTSDANKPISNATQNALNNKLNSTTSDGISVESLLELFRDNVTKEISVGVFAETGTLSDGEHYMGSGSITILPNSTNKKISNLTITDFIGKANASYNETAGVISYNLYNKNANTKTSGIIKYTITINQYLEN